MDAKDLQSLSPNRAWVGMVQNQVCTSCAIGLCDSVFCNFVRGAEAWFYDEVLINWDMAATVVNGVAQAADVSGDDLEVTTDQKYDLMSQSGGGVGGTIGGGWFEKGLAHTDGLDGGTPVDRNFVMTVCGASVRIGLPGQRGAEQDTASDPFVAVDWLEPAGDGPNYSQRLQALTIEITALRLKMGDTGAIYYLGATCVFPSAFAAFGSNIVTNGILNYPLAYTPFAVCFCIGSQFDLKRATLLLTVDQNTRIQSHATRPTKPWTSTAVSDDPETLSGTVYVPYQLFLFGYICCFDSASYCGGLSIAESEAVRVFLATQGLLPGAVAGVAPGRQIGAVLGNQLIPG